MTSLKLRGLTHKAWVNRPYLYFEPESKLLFLVDNRFMRSQSLNSKERRFVSIAIAFVFSTLATTFSYAAPLAERPIDVVAVNWPGSRAATVTVDQVEQSIQEYVAPNWRSFTTSQGGPITTAINFVPGITSLEPISLTRPMPCEGSSSVSFMTLVQREFYRSQKISNYDNRYLIILSPEAGCAWQGKAPLGSPTSEGGVLTLHNTASGFVITHELGHTFGLGHSNFLYCSDGARDGNWSNVCKALEYGGTIDVMGNVETTSPLSTYHQWRMGLISDEFIYQSWVNESVTLSASDVYGSTRAIFIRDGKATYWIEYRRDFGQYKAGLVIYRTDPPPNSAIDSPNPSDFFAAEPTMAITTDVWMLNWDTYKYSTSPTSATGSMTLPQGKTATLYSGNVSLSAQASSDSSSATVTINRKADKTPPPTPTFSSPKTWRSGNTDIVIKGRVDNESKIDFFELRMEGVIKRVQPSGAKDWMPTYLEPFSAPATVLVKDLPEGSYQLAIRSVDVWGNKSQWSDTEAVRIDRTPPKVTSDIKILKADEKELSWQWIGASDKDSRLCDTQLADETGWIQYQSKPPSTPSFTFPLNSKRSFSARVFDCFGNGLRGEVELESKSIALDTPFKKTGKWSYLAKDSLRCSGRCSLTVPSSKNLFISLSSGSASVSLLAKQIAKVSAKNSASINAGGSNRTLQITGSNFTISRLASMKFTASNFAATERKVAPIDSSTLASEQENLARLGFRAGDFIDEVMVAPMPRGTTLLDPTLDLCGATFASEASRIARRQMVATKDDSPYEFLSSESVRYANTTSASNALAELKAVVNQCKRDLGGTSALGFFTPHKFFDLDIALAGLLPEGNRVVVRADIGRGENERNLFAIYQFSGQYFTGLYVTKNGGEFDNQELANWIEVGASLAKRLQLMNSSN